MFQRGREHLPGVSAVETRSWSQCVVVFNNEIIKVNELFFKVKLIPCLYTQFLSKPFTILPSLASLSFNMLNLEA